MRHRYGGRDAPRLVIRTENGALVSHRVINKPCAELSVLKRRRGRGARKAPYEIQKKPEMRDQFNEEGDLSRHDLSSRQQKDSTHFHPVGMPSLLAS